MNVFDNALLQSGGGREKLAQVAQANQDLVPMLDSTTQSIRSQIGRADDPSTPDVDESAGAIGTTNQVQKDSYQKIQDALNSWKTGFTPKVKSAQDDLTARQNAINQDIGGTDYLYNQNTLDQFGLQDGDHLYDVDLKNYIQNVSPSDINAANVASAQDYARYAALADLAGDQSGILKPEDVSKAGTAPNFTIDSVKLKGDLAAKAKAFNDTLDSKGGIGSVLGIQLGNSSVIGNTNLKDLSIREAEQFLTDLKNQYGRGSELVNNYYDAIMPKIAEWKSSQFYNAIAKKEN